MNSSTAINGSNFTITVDGAAYGSGYCIIQTTSNSKNNAHNPKIFLIKEKTTIMVRIICFYIIGVLLNRMP